MQIRWLKSARVLVATLALAGLFLAFADFRGWMPVAVAHNLAETQFVPSMVALLTGASIALAGVVILVLTFFVGRIYCSAICPLGILQDVVIRLKRWLPGNSKRLNYSTGYPKLRLAFLLICAAGILTGWARFTLSLLDPYSIFGRIVSGLFRPVITLLNNSIVRVGNAMGVDSIYRVDPQWAGVGALSIPILTLMLVVGMAIWKGRLYCNAVCPVGTLLGYISSRGIIKLSIDKNACRKCGDCLKACKSQCIDLRSGTIDFSRCVSCFNCLGACKEKAIHYQNAWQKASAVKVAVSEPRDPQRRKFVGNAALAAGALGTGLLTLPTHSEEPRSSVVTPPGSSSLDRFLNRCTACQLCISACPTHVLQPACLEYGVASLMKPRMDYRHAFCNFDCVQCAQACPDGAITLLDLERKKLTRIGIAKLDLDKCVVKTKGTDCAACSEHCPTKAVDTIPYGNNLRLPRVSEELCIGCGACEYACPVQPQKAITVKGLNHHELAVKRIEKKLEKPKNGGDFPF